MTPEFREVMEKLRAQYAEALRDMPLPDGVPEYVQELMAKGDTETLLLMLKLSWVFGAQAGQAAQVQVQTMRVPTAQA
ncbi:DdrH [Deinococcus cellulosilyticus]|uniref:DdrH n=1 Tax=Deinococcus cellulosilyticus (strain DSM 18568 / NBRC 106333 / KACC 11606 / 5516J-15) TaxID=1223518 RepID=A0A511N4V5_DEIC1|nr:DdrH [Deinococcus cellulosilyticus]GEM47476.1 hypothetical protein DC3_31110 [Deinococcus cellulosilyticus NBRC 106333 = KACC 11606]